MSTFSIVPCLRNIIYALGVSLISVYIVIDSELSGSDNISRIAIHLMHANLRGIRNLNYIN